MPCRARTKQAAQFPATGVRDAGLNEARLRRSASYDENKPDGTCSNAPANILRLRTVRARRRKSIGAHHRQCLMIHSSS